MSDARPVLKRLITRRAQLSVLSALSLLFLAATLALTLQVYFRLGDYDSAASDNMQWTMAQLEVDHAKLQAEAERIPYMGAAVLPELRRRFDAFYSRADLLCKGPVYAQALKGSEAAPVMDRILKDIEAIVPLVDGDDDALVAAAPELSARIAALAEPVKTVSTLSVRIYATRSETERRALTSKLSQLAVLSLLMLVALASLTALLWQLYRLYRRRALANRMTLNRLSTILNTSQDAILVIAPDGRIVDSNKAAQTRFGLENTARTEKRVGDILLCKDEDGQVQPISGDRLLGSCADGPNLCTKLLARDVDGHVFPVEMSADLANRAGNEVCVCFLRDISRRAAAQAEIEAALDRALAGEQARARFLGMVSHEMRTPLNGLLGALDLLDESGLSPEQERYSRIMHSAGQQLLTQINDTLDFTQAGSGKLSLNIGPFDLDALLTEAAAGVSTLAEANGTRLVVNPSGQRLGTVEGDRARVLQVLVNLLSNAVKFTHDGEITLDATRPDPAAPQVEVQVIDTGVGIPEQDLPRIFDDFVRLEETHPAMDQPGTGLGLGIVRQLATVMDGECGADSIPGEGSLFWVRLPLPPVGAEPRTLGNESTGKVDTRPLDILVAEDNSTNRFVLGEMLRKDGHRVVSVPDGETAVEKAGAQGFDLILLDIRMPGIDGVEAARRIREAQGPSRAARIAFLTAHIQTEDNASLRAAGAEAVLAKPLRRSVLRNLIAGRHSGGMRPVEPPTGPVDTQVVEQLRDSLPVQGFSDLMTGFMDEGERFVSTLPELRSLPPKTAMDRVHGFAGTAATCGAIALQAALGRAEAALAEGDVEKARRALDEVPRLWQQTREGLLRSRDAA